MPCTQPCTTKRKGKERRCFRRKKTRLSLLRCCCLAVFKPAFREVLLSDGRKALLESRKARCLVSPRCSCLTSCRCRPDRAADTRVSSQPCTAATRTVSTGVLILQVQAKILTLTTVHSCNTDSTHRGICSCKDPKPIGVFAAVSQDLDPPGWS